MIARRRAVALSLAALSLGLGTACAGGGKGTAACFPSGSPKPLPTGSGGGLVIFGGGRELHSGTAHTTLCGGLNGSADIPLVAGGASVLKLSDGFVNLLYESGGDSLSIFLRFDPSSTDSLVPTEVSVAGSLGGPGFRSTSQACGVAVTRLDAHGIRGRFQCVHAVNISGGPGVDAVGTFSGST